MYVDITREPKLSRTDHLVVFLAEDSKQKLELPAALRSRIERIISRAGFVGRSDASITVLEGTAPKKITLAGLGKEGSLTPRGVRGAMSSVGKIAKRNRDKSVAVMFPYILAGLDARATTRLLADLLTQSAYSYDKYKTSKDNGKPTMTSCTLIAPRVEPREAKKIVAEAAAISAGVTTVKDLGNGPSNEVTPRRIAARALEVGRETGVKCTVFDRKQIEKLKMGGLLAVNRGSAEEPRFIVLEYSPTKKAKKTVCLVGKGITFDSGGISIKPAEKMEEMKYDMCGAAAVIGTMEAVAKLKLPVHVYGIIASTENLPSGTAYKPGDIVTTMSGKTIEVINTDAEGRVILSDALHYASKLNPDHIIDFATLTGACVVALANEASGVFTADDGLAQKLIGAGERVGERLWRLPLWDDYKDYIRSDWADVKNSGGRWGGAVTAAIFLKEFVTCPSWAHIDIAGTAWSERDSAREAKGATGVGVRATIDFLESLS